MGKSTISIAIFNCYLYVHQRVHPYRPIASWSSFPALVASFLPRSSQPRPRVWLCAVGWLFIVCVAGMAVSQRSYIYIYTQTLAAVEPDQHSLCWRLFDLPLAHCLSPKVPANRKWFEALKKQRAVQSQVAQIQAYLACCGILICFNWAWKLNSTSKNDCCRWLPTLIGLV